MSSDILIKQQNLLDQYYLETKSDARQNLLQQYIHLWPACGLNSLRKKISIQRYKERTDIDRFLWQYLNLLYLYKSSRSKWMKKSANKEIDEIIEEIGFHEAAKLGEAGENELYRELYNVAKLYINVCNSDKSYKTKFFGSVAINDDQVKAKIATDTWKIAVGIPERFNQKKVFEPLSKAAKDALFDFYPDAQLLWEHAKEIGDNNTQN